MHGDTSCLVAGGDNFASRKQLTVGNRAAVGTRCARGEVRASPWLRVFVVEFAAIPSKHHAARGDDDTAKAWDEHICSCSKPRRTSAEDLVAFTA
jgi:hypothetical protein